MSEDKPQANIISIEPATAASSSGHLDNQSCYNFIFDQKPAPENLPHEFSNVSSSKRKKQLIKPPSYSRTGHSDDSGGTLIGSGRKNVESKHNYSMKSTKSFPPTFAPLCSGCGGGHLGIECWKRKQHCHWCGRMGHSEDVCWRKAGACLICGSKSRRLRQCSHYIPLHAPVFPPWCLTCGTTHLGSNCEDPYME